MSKGVVTAALLQVPSALPLKYRVFHDGCASTLRCCDAAFHAAPLQGMEGRLDAVICLLGTFSHMTTNDQAVASFQCIAKHLRQGGFFLMELAHPGGCTAGG